MEKHKDDEIKIDKVYIYNPNDNKKNLIIL